MLSRTAAALYWLGRYVERAEFTAQLVEATLRLDQLAARPAGSEAWSSALAVATATPGFAATGAPLNPAEVARYLLLSTANPSSIRSCIDAARHNARAARRYGDDPEPGGRGQGGCARVRRRAQPDAP
jgi:uncharacterized alpha-E superfamily protein